VKFSCERCGKKYSTAETPAAGRIHKIDCKDCGHLIIVKASPGAPASPATEMHPPAGPRSPASEPPAAPEGVDAADGPDVALASHAGLDAPEHGRPSGDALYVDLFADASRPDLEQTDPAWAARSPLPEGHAQGPSERDDHATLLNRLPSPPATALPPRVTGHVATTTPKIPSIPRPPRHGSALPMALLGAGALVVAGIVAFVLLGGKAPVAPRAAVQADASAAAPEVVRRSAVAAPPAIAAPAPDAPKPTRERTPAPAAADGRRAEDRPQRDRGARERERLAREQQARAERDLRQAEHRERQRSDAERIAAADPQEDPGGLSQATVERVLTSTRNAFERCILAAAKSSEVALDGRRVMLRLNIQNTGAVTYPTLDDVTLAGTELGACLKNAARLMVFPKFMGDPMHVEVPLALVGR
jgi:DNA-directed RNA polymerase subunit RPC12/RpoP